MSFKDLEKEIKAWADLEAFAKRQKEEHEEARRQVKRDKRAKKNRPPMFKPDAPIRYQFVVTLAVRDVTDRVWGDISHVNYTVTDTISRDEAELKAMRQAVADQFAVISVVSIVDTTAK